MRCFDMHGKLYRLILFLPIVFLFLFQCAAAESETKDYSITFHYSGAGKFQQTITIDFSDEWLLQPDNEYNHKLMQASFGLAAAGFRDKEHDLSQKDYNIHDFFSQLEFSDILTEDFNKPTSINTIGTAIASKQVKDAVIIAVSVSGNNYQNEWQSNLTVDDENRPAGFNSAADKVWARVQNYIETAGLNGNLRLWISGYSRAAAVSNIVAADATDSGLFDAVYGYTIATPRTTNETDAAKYPNIFNIINPFDPVPMVPFPEWGFVRYGTDFFLPSRETDSDYALKKARADEYSMSAYHHSLHYNPLINSQLHTILDFSLFFISSANSYKETFQNGMVNFWKNRDVKQLVEDISTRILKMPEITKYQLTEFYEMLDYLMQITYTNFASQKFHRKIGLWDPALSLQENLMHEHYDEAYRSWLFSFDDPAELFRNDPRYIHYSILGDVDVAVYDSQDDFILWIDRNGTISSDLVHADSQLTDNPRMSTTDLFGIRQDQQTLVIFPMDQTFTAVIYPHRDEDIRISYVEYIAKELHGNVKLILDEPVKTDEVFSVQINSELIDEITDEELLKEGLHKVEPWTKDIVYSASAVMRLENTGIFHPSPIVFLTFGGLALLLVLFILVLGLIGTGKGIKKGVRAIRKRRADVSNE